MIGTSRFEKDRVRTQLYTAIVFLVIGTIYHCMQNEHYWNSLKYVDKDTCSQINYKIAHATSYELSFGENRFQTKNDGVMKQLIGNVLGSSMKLAYDENYSSDLDNAQIVCNIDKDNTIVICSSENRWNEEILLLRDGTIKGSYFIVYDKGGIRNNINIVFNKYLKLRGLVNG